MKSIRHLILKVTSKSSPLSVQMELALPGSRVTRAEADFLRQIRHLRRQLAQGEAAAGKV
jgi:hypothetical protein